MVHTTTLAYTDGGFLFSNSFGERVEFSNGVFRSFLDDDDDWVYSEMIWQYGEAVTEALFLLGVIEHE